MAKESGVWNRVKIASATNGVGRSGQVYEKKIKPDHKLTPYIRVNSTWIEVLNIYCGTVKVLEENIGSKFSDMSSRNIFANAIS